jgi:hypothetical protein
MATPTDNQPKRLIAPTQLTASVATLYTSPSGQKGTRLTAIILINDSTAAQTATLHLVPPMGTAGDDNIICKAATVPGDGFPVVLDARGLIMNASDTIQGKASAATTVTIHISGIEMN